MLYFILFFLVIGSGMAIGRGTTDALFFKRYGIEYLPVMYIILGCLLFLTSTFYAAFSDRLPPEKFFRILNSILISLLVMAWVSMSFFNFKHIYPVYFLIYEIASEVLLIHAALYLAKNLDVVQAKRLTPIVLAGSQIGTIIGGLFLALSAPHLGVQNLLLVWCMLLFLGIIMITWHHKRTGHSLYFRHPRKHSNKMKQSMIDISVGMKYMKKSDLVRYSSFALFCMVIVFYILSYTANRIYNDTFKTEESLTAFFGLVAVITNSLALVFQLFITNRVIQRFGIKTVNLFFPFSTMISYLFLIFSFALPSAIVTSINKDSIMPAFRNPVRSLFYNALPNYIQGRARAMSVVVVIPLALLVCGGVLWTVQQMNNPLYFLSIGLILTCFYAYFNLRMNKAYVLEIVSNLRNKLYIPGKHEQTAIKSGGIGIFEELREGVEHNDDQICIAYAKTLANTFPEKAVPILIERLQGAISSTRNELFQILVPLNPEKLHGYLWQEFGTADIHLQTTILKQLFKLGDDRAISGIEQKLIDPNPRLRAAAIYGSILHRPDDIRAYELLNALLKSDDPGEVLSGLETLYELGEIDSKITSHIEKSHFIKLLSNSNSRIWNASLRVISLWPSSSLPELVQYLKNAFNTTNEPDVRSQAIRCAHVLGSDDEHDFIVAALDDSHPLVREDAINLLKDENQKETFTSWIIDTNLGSPRTQSTILSKLQEAGTPVHIMENIALAKALDAEMIEQVIITLKNHHEILDLAPVELLVYALQERLEQVIDLTLQALKSIEDTTTINLIQAGIKCSDKRIASQSMEALRNIENQKLAIILANIMEGYLASGPAKAQSIQTFRSAEHALDWCSNRHDPWLKACANDASRVITQE